MNIAVIVNSFPSISEKYLLNQIISLLKLDQNIDIYAAVPSREQIHHKLFDNELLKNRIIQVNIPRSAWKRLLYFPVIFLQDFFHSPHRTLNALSAAKYSSAALNLKNLYFFKAFYKKDYDIVHCHFGQNGLTGAYLKDCGFCRKLVVTFHGTDITATPGKFGKNMYRYMFTCTDHITAGSHFIRNLITKYGGGNLHVIPMGINPVPLKEKNAGSYFLSVGRLVEVKGFTYSITAFSALAERFSGVQYYIAGNGPFRDSLCRQIKQLRLEDKVFLLGEKTGDELEPLYNRAAALVFPSIRAPDGSEEGQGLVIQEAESRGIPVIATNTGGIPDGIISGVTGWLVPEKDPAALCEKMVFFLEHPEKQREFGEAGYRFAVANYDNVLLAKRLVDEVYLS
jgi:colanic acid/amylovoran biosynthesis glycosyltransferase